MPDAPLNFSRYDRVFESAGAEGVGLLPILNWAPRWAVPVTEHLGEWRAFVRAAAFDDTSARVIAPFAF